MNKVKFPGFNLEFTLNETAFTVFGLDIKWYGIIITTGILLSFLLFYRLAVKREQLDPDSIYNITLLVMPIAIIGARFVYVVTEWEDRFKGKGFLNMINIRQGGIAIYGAIIFGLITVLIYNKIKKQSSLSMLDALAPAVMLGQTIGRWGNFVNAEAYGWSEGVENLPWRMWLEKVYIDDIYQPDIHFVHPTFLYESLWNALGLAIILLFLYRKKKFNGEIFFAYIGWYGLGRAYIETLRADSLYIVGSLKFSVFVGIVCVIAAVIGELVLYSRHKEEKNEMAEYTSAFETVRIAMSKEEDALDQSVFEAEGGSEDEAEDEAEALDELDENDTEVLAEQDMLDGDIEDIEDIEEEE
ncbi:MAG: prolipoprotein diacylglyceryl transferase [Clostridia bacterium]|nr:prolipoprotein diacylglyceryl transferase [Clostridia bacterium]